MKLLLWLQDFNASYVISVLVVNRMWRHSHGSPLTQCGDMCENKMPVPKFKFMNPNCTFLASCHRGTSREIRHYKTMLILRF